MTKHLEEYFDDMEMRLTSALLNIMDVGTRRDVTDWWMKAVEMESGIDSDIEADKRRKETWKAACEIAGKVTQHAEYKHAVERGVRNHSTVLREMSDTSHYTGPSAAGGSLYE